LGGLQTGSGGTQQAGTQTGAGGGGSQTGLLGSLAGSLLGFGGSQESEIAFCPNTALTAMRRVATQGFLISLSRICSSSTR